MSKFVLSSKEKGLLFRTNDITPPDFKNLIEDLQAKFNVITSEIEITESDIEKIIRYIKDYKNNGLQIRLSGIFHRHFDMFDRSNTAEAI